MRLFAICSLLAVGVTFVAGVPTSQQRIVGGSTTDIASFPFSAALLSTQDFIIYLQRCGGTIINNRSVMTAAHCVFGDAPIRWQIRIGSSNSNFGGTVVATSAIFVHPNYNFMTMNYDISVIRSATTFVFTTTVRATSIAGAAFVVPDNTAVTAIGWGSTTYQGVFSDILRQVQVWTVNQVTCRNRYAELGRLVTDNMLCTGWLDVGGRDQCTGDNGSPILHNNVTIGVRSWGQGCGLGRYPGVSTRVSRFSSWVAANA